MNRFDALAILAEVLLAAKRNALEAARHPDDPFESGQVMAYYDVLTVAIEQADLMGVPLKDIGLEGFDPDQELLRARKPAAV